MKFIEVHVATPLDECERRDTKGLYAKVRSGDMTGLSGVDSPYEAPESPEVWLKTELLDPQACVEHVHSVISRN